MSISFFIIGGVIFATYILLTFWNIFYSNQKQKEENYPDLNQKSDKEDNKTDE